MSKFTDAFKKVFIESVKRDAEITSEGYDGSSNILDGYFSSYSNSDMTGKPAKEQVEQVYSDMQAGGENAVHAYDAFLQYAGLAYTNPSMMGTTDQNAVSQILGRESPDFDLYTDFQIHANGSSGFLGIGSDHAFGAGSKLYDNMAKELKQNVSGLDSKIRELEKNNEVLGGVIDNTQKNYESAVAERDKAYVDYINNTIRDEISDMYAADYMMQRAQLAASMTSNSVTYAQDQYNAYAKSLVKFELSKTEEADLPTKAEYDAAMNYLSMDENSPYHGMTVNDIKTTILSESRKEMMDAFAQTVYKSGCDLSDEIGLDRQNGKTASNELIQKYFNEADKVYDGGNMPMGEQEVDTPDVNQEQSEPSQSSGSGVSASPDETTTEQSGNEVTDNTPDNTQDEQTTNTDNSASAAEDNDSLSENTDQENSHSTAPANSSPAAFGAYMTAVNAVHNQTVQPTGSHGQDHEHEAVQGDMPMGEENEITGDPYSAENIAKRYELANGDPKEIAKLDYDVARAVWMGDIKANGDARKELLGENYDRIQSNAIEHIANGEMSAFLQEGTAEYDAVIDQIAADSKPSLGSTFSSVTNDPGVKNMQDNISKGVSNEAETKTKADKTAERAAMVDAIAPSDGVSAELDGIGL